MSPSMSGGVQITHTHTHTRTRARVHARPIAQSSPETRLIKTVNCLFHSSVILGSSPVSLKLRQD